MCCTYFRCLSFQTIAVSVRESGGDPGLRFLQRQRESLPRGLIGTQRDKLASRSCNPYRLLPPQRREDTKNRKEPYAKGQRRYASARIFLVILRVFAS